MVQLFDLGSPLFGQADPFELQLGQFDARGLEHLVLRLRGNPPELADARRKEIYGASLRQASTLFNTANTIDLNVKPILAHYAFVQAGSALIAAAMPSGEGYMPRGHGLSIDAEHALSVGDVKVTTSGNGRRGSFQMFCRALGANITIPDGLTVTIAQLWSSNLYMQWGKTLRSSTPLLSAIEFTRDTAWFPSSLGEGPVTRNLAELYGSNTTIEDFRRDFPLQAPGSHAPEPWTTDSKLVGVDPRSLRPSLLSTHGSQYPISTMIPTWAGPISGDFGLLPTVVNYWLLLYGLSMSARYLSGLWGRAITIDGSPDYLPLRDELSVIVLKVYSLALARLADAVELA